MADLPSILGGMAQGFIDFGKGAVDLFGTGGAAIGDLVDTIKTGKVSTKNQDDFRKWLYNTNDVQDAAAKGLGTALNGVQTVTDYIPGIGAVTKNPLFNAGQGALGGLADEFKTYGKDYDLGRAGERAAVSAGAALASGSLGDALKKSANPLLSSGAVQGLARGATGGAITGGGYAAIDGGDMLEAAKQGAGMGALIGGATGAFQDFKPAKTYDMGLTDAERASRLKEVRKMRNAYGRYSHPVLSAGGDLAIFERKMSSPEDAVSTMAHERLHSFQGEAESRNKARYNQEVIDAYNDLHNELKDHYKDWGETAKRYGSKGTAYWQRTDEQEARMLQTYLENRGYAQAEQMQNKYRKGEWGDEINPAFDKFFDKLRDLSKRGVALPAITALLGGGAYMASQNNDKEKEVK